MKDRLITTGVACKMLGCRPKKFTRLVIGGDIQAHATLVGVGPKSAHETPLFLESEIERIRDKERASDG